MTFQIVLYTSWKDQANFLIDWQSSVQESPLNRVLELRLSILIRICVNSRPDNR